MSKQLKQNQWKLFFEKFEELNISDFWFYYSKHAKKAITKDSKRWFRKKYLAYKRGNTNIIRSMTGKNQQVDQKRKK